ncbi:uncharacterized protein KZ484_021482 [Pholidichthys leucotaenia]
MEEDSYETFEEEFWPPRADPPPPQRPARQLRKSEMYATRKITEELAQVPQQPRPEPQTLPKELSFTGTTSIERNLPTQALTEIETPWENVTLNRCLFVAITILVLTSGFQRFNETLRGHRTADEEEDAGLTMRHTAALRHRGESVEPETSLWELMFWWLPDLDDEEDDDDDDDEGVKRRLKKGVIARTSRGLRNRPLPDKKLMKQRDGKLKDRRGKKIRDEDIKAKKEMAENEEPEEGPAEADEEEAGDAPAKNFKKSQGKKEQSKKG